MRKAAASVFGVFCLISLPFAYFSVLVLDTPQASAFPGVLLAYLLIASSWLLFLTLGNACFSLLNEGPGWQRSAVMPLFPLATLMIAGLLLGVF